MYNFVDTTAGSASSSALPAEALQINGAYIENEIEGYRTLYVTGREILSQELTTYETGVRDGSNLSYRRYPSRTITVGYQLIAEDNESFREAYNKLNALLDVEDAEMITADIICITAWRGRPGRTDSTDRSLWRCVIPRQENTNISETSDTRTGAP